MAEPRKAVNKKKGLPPLSPKSEPDGADGDVEPKPVRRRPKKKVVKTEDEEDNVADETSTVPPTKKKKKRAPSQNRESENEPPTGTPADGDVPVTPKKKKKKKPKAAADEPDENQNETTEPGKKKKDGQGSKTSLLSKEGETPRKKGVKKKKKVKKSPGADDEFGENTWAEDLRTLEDDILSSPRETTEKEEDGDDDEEAVDSTTTKPKLQTKFLTGPMLKSQPLDKIFVESSRKFKGLNKSTLNKQIAEETVKAEIMPVVTRKTTIDFALASHQIFRVVGLFLHGLTAGLCLWQMVNIFTLTTFSTTDFLLHYRKTSLPLQCVLYFLLSLCLVSACDRFDIGNPMPRFVLRAFTLQNGAVSIVFYLIALILNVITIKYEDKIYLYEEPKIPSANTTVKDDEIDTFKSLNTARCIFAVLGWFILSITPNADRLGKNLKSGETGLENELQMDGVSAA